MQCNFSFITLSGTPAERGRKYGSAAKKQIDVSLGLYAKLFKAYAALSWDEAKKKSLKFEKTIQDYCPNALEEMQGIAEGCGKTYEDILALNCRSELMFALPDGCSAIALVPEAARGKTIIAQTWDWLKECRPGTVILEIHQEPLPTILTVSEAGMVGGKGLNSSGIGVCLNAMSIGRGQIGVPLHLIYRGILNSRTITDALDQVSEVRRAGAGNFTIASSTGIALCFEYTPDNFDVLMSEGEPLCHTNHYLSPLFKAEDKLKSSVADTHIRYNMLRRLSKKYTNGLGVEDVWTILSDHTNFPDSICSHEDPANPESSRFCTVYAALFDLNSKVLWVTNGNPCEGRAYPFYLLP
jgi:isopenicillin-N N-acyltransferase-like protein